MIHFVQFVLCPSKIFTLINIDNNIQSSEHSIKNAPPKGVGLRRPLHFLKIVLLKAGYLNRIIAQFIVSKRFHSKRISEIIDINHFRYK